MGIPRALPALARAVKLRKRAYGHSNSDLGAGRAVEPPVDPRVERDVEAQSGFDLADFESALAILVDEARRRSDDEPGKNGQAQLMLGRLLSRCVDAARNLGIDPEEALRAENFEFERRMAENRSGKAHAQRGPA